MESTATQDEPSISEFELAIRWHQAPATISLWRQSYHQRLPPNFKVGLSTRYLLSEVEKFEAKNSVENS
jgi:hypothetical protein